MLGVDQLEDLTQMSDSKDMEWVALDLLHFLHLKSNGIEPTVPDILFDTKVHNEAALSMIVSLEEAVRECAMILREHGHSEYLNLISVFFAEIIKILCSAMFMEIEFDDVLEMDDLLIVKGSDLAVSKLQFLTYQQLIDPSDRISFPGPIHSGAPRLRRRLFESVTAMIRGFQGNVANERTVFLSYNCQVSETKRQYLNRMFGIKNRIYFKRCPASYNRIWIPEYERQLNVLESCILEIRAKFQPRKIPNPLRGSELLKMVLDRVHPHLASESNISIDGDLFVAGSLSNIRARIPAVNFKSRGIPVMGVWHGDCFGVYEEPVMGYGEGAFADVIVGYGTESDQVDFDSPPWNTDLTEFRKVVPSSATLVQNLYSREPIPRICDIPNPRFLYIPTSLAGTWRYGPYRDMHDIGYLHWQIGLMSVFGNIFKDQITWKLHPSDKVIRTEHHKLLDLSGVKIAQKESAENLIESCDVLVFDYHATSFNRAAATSKPIVYFDIGLRNLSHVANAAVLERCIYINSDPKQPELAFNSFLDSQDRKCQHGFVPKFCLSSDYRPRIEVIGETISDLLKSID